jgi:hypothetical protein
MIERRTGVKIPVDFVVLKDAGEKQRAPKSLPRIHTR